MIQRVYFNMHKRIKITKSRLAIHAALKCKALNSILCRQVRTTGMEFVRRLSVQHVISGARSQECHYWCILGAES